MSRLWSYGSIVLYKLCIIIMLIIKTGNWREIDEEQQTDAVDSFLDVEGHVT